MWIEFSASLKTEINHARWESAAENVASFCCKFWWIFIVKFLDEWSWTLKSWQAFMALNLGGSGFGPFLMIFVAKIGIKSWNFPSSLTVIAGWTLFLIPPRFFYAFKSSKSSIRKLFNFKSPIDSSLPQKTLFWPPPSLPNHQKSTIN